MALVHLVAIIWLAPSIFAQSSTLVLEDELNNAVDSILVDLTSKYESMKADDFWHPYDFGTGNENREVVIVSSMSQQHIPGEYIEWHTVKMGVKQSIVGLTLSSIDLYNSKLEKDMSKELAGVSLKTLKVYTRWDSVTQEPFMIFVVATSEPSIVVLRSLESELIEMGSFPQQFQVKQIILGQADNMDQIILVPENSSNPITIFNFEMTTGEEDVLEDPVHLWFFQRVMEQGFQSVIAHQPDTTDSILIVSQGNQLNIYSLDRELGQYAVQQRLHLEDEKGCENMFSFTMMYQHYLGCTTTGKEDTVHFISYNYNMHEYEEHIQLNQVNAKEMVPVSIEGTREDLLFISKGNPSPSSGSGIKLLTFDGQKDFNVGHQCSLDSCSRLDAISNGATLVLNDQTAFVFPTGSDPSGAPVLTFFTEILATHSPVFDQSTGLFEIFKELSKRTNAYRLVVSEAERTLSNKLDLNGDNEITGVWSVKSIKTEDVDVNVEVSGRAARSESIFNTLQFANATWTDDDFSSTSDQILLQMGVMEENINFMKTELSQALRKNSPSVQLVKAQTIIQGEMIANNAEIKRYSGKTLWEQDSNEFFNSLAHQGKDVLNIEMGVNFAKMPTIANVNTGSINNVPVSEMARLSNDNVISCSSTFEQVESLEDIHVTMVNSKTLPESVVTVDRIDGFNFIDGIVATDGAESTESLPFDDVLLSSTPQAVPSLMVFPVLQTSSPVSVGSIGNVDFQTFADKIVFNNFQGKITGKKAFTEDVSLDTLLISGTWNGQSFPQSFIRPSDSNIILSGKKSFHKLNADQLILNDKVDGINTEDLVSLSSPEEIKATWIFNGETRIVDDIGVDNTVDGIRMESLEHEGLLHSTAQTFTPNADIIFQGLVQLESLHVLNTINDKDFDGIFGDVLLFEGETCNVPGQTMILGDVVFGNLSLKEGKVNGFSIENFFTKHTSQTITSPVLFTGPTTFQEFIAMQAFDSVRVEDVLSKAMRISQVTGTTVPWDVHFEKISCQDQLVVEGPLNGITNYKNSVAKTRGEATQTFLGRVILEKPVFNKLVTEHLTLDSGRTLQTLDVVVWNTSRAKLSEPAAFSQRFTVNRIIAQSDVELERVNGVLVTDLEDNVFRTDREQQTFTGPIIVKNNMTVLNGDVTFHKTVDGFLLNDFIEHGFPLNVDNDEPIKLTDHWQFSSFAISKNIEMDETNVCGVDLKSLQMESVKRSDKNIEISGEKTFMQPMEIRGSLNSARVNGKMMDKVFRLNNDQIIEEAAVFNSDVSKSHLDADSINNIDMKWLSSIYSFTEGKHILNHDVLIKGNMLMDSLQVSGNINNRDLTQFLSSVFTKSASEIEFKDQVIFQEPVVMGEGSNLEVGKYNGINVDKLKQNVVRQDEAIVWGKVVHFPGTIRSNDLQVGGNLEARSLTNGVDFNNMRDNAIRLNEDGLMVNLDNLMFEHVTISKQIETKNLNGNPFENFATLSTEQNLGTLRFVKAMFDESNVDVNGIMGGVKVVDVFNDTLMKNGEVQRFTGSVKIEGPVQVMNNMECFGPDFGKQVFTTREDIELKGPIEFSEPLVVHEVVVSKPIQGHTIESIFDHAFTQGEGKEQLISKTWHFQGPVTFMDNVTGQGLGNKVNIQALVTEKQEMLEEAKREVIQQRNRFQRKCTTLSDIRNVVAAYPVKLDSFDLHQTIRVASEAKNILAVETGENENIQLLLQTANCQLTRYQWRPEIEVFHKVVDAPLILGKVESWQSIAHEQGAIVVLSTTTSDCSPQAGLFYTKISDTGVSPLTSISPSSAKSFKVIRNEGNGKLMIFALFAERSKELDIFEWDQIKDQFVQKAIIRFSSKMERVDVISISFSEFRILCHNKDELQTYQYSSTSGNNRVLLESAKSIKTSGAGPMIIFQNFDTTFALVLEEASNPTLIQPACNFQVVRFSQKGVMSSMNELPIEMESLQKLHVPEVLSATHFHLADKNFMAFLSKSYGLSIYKFMGLNGFQPISLPSKVFDAFMLHSFSVQREGFVMPQPFILTLSTNKIEIFRGNVFGDKFTPDFKQLCGN